MVRPASLGDGVDASSAALSDLDLGFVEAVFDCKSRKPTQAAMKDESHLETLFHCK